MIEDDWLPDADWDSLNYKDRIAILYLINVQIFNYFHTICEDTAQFLPPDSDLTLIFRRLRTTANFAEDSEIDSKIGWLNPIEFPDIQQKKDDLYRHWHDFKPKFMEYSKNLSNEYARLFGTSTKITVPRVVGILITASENALKYYINEKQSITNWRQRNRKSTPYPSNYYFDDKAFSYMVGKHRMKFQKRSNLGKIMRLLDKAKGEPLLTMLISDRIGESKKYVIRAIANLNSRIKKDKQLVRAIQIDHLSKQGYKLTSLQVGS